MNLLNWMNLVLAVKESMYIEESHEDVFVLKKKIDGIQFVVEE